MLSTILTYSIVALIILFFLLVAARDLAMLLRRPSKAGTGLGSGPSRIWAVAHTTLLEAWAARIYLLPVLWLVVSLILLLVIRPYDESERIPLYIRMLLYTQEILLLVMVGILACISLPRERERKIIITNASKPISRLEIMLGKIAGFSLAALFLLLVMSVATWRILVVADYWMRASARAEYALAQHDYDAKVRKQEAAAPVPLDKKELADKGSLFANNYVTPDKNFSIVGAIDRTKTPPVRYLKGGSEEKILYTFPALLADKDADVLPHGQRPYFAFNFPVLFTAPNPPPSIALNISASRTHQPANSGAPTAQQKTLLLNAANHWRATWEPDDLKDLFGSPDEPVGEVAVFVSCPTPGVLLEIREGTRQSYDAFNVLAYPRSATIKIDAFIPQPNPVVHGFDRYDKQQIAGPSKLEAFLYKDRAPVENAIFRFHAADLDDVPVDDQHNFTLHMYLDVDKESNANFPTQATVLAYSDAAPAAPQSASVEVNEKRDTRVTLPASLLGSDPAQRRDLVILLSCQTTGHWLAMNENSIRIERPPSPFLLNLLKSEAVIFCEAALLIVIAVAFSTRLGWPVALLATATCFFLGYCRDFISITLTNGGLASLGFMSYGNESTTFKTFDSILAACWGILHFIIFLLPDFTRFDFLSSITQLRNMPWPNLAFDAGWTLLYSLPFIALGYLLFRKQELG